VVVVRARRGRGDEAGTQNFCFVNPNSIIVEKMTAILVQSKFSDF
jgi:hypothetical protein